MVGIMNMPAFDNDLKEQRGADASSVENASRDFRLGADQLPSWRDAKAALERWLLTEALRRTGGNMAAAGRMLGVTKVAVLHAVRRHGLDALTRPVQGD
jgi:transcriptional regulator with GAF, ATPase, and Fis domain